MSKKRVAVDVGGTFTDVIVFDELTAEVSVAKVASTPDDPMRAVIDSVDSAEVDLEEVTLFSHGTTVATNALITRNFAPAAMVTTEGFRDVIEIGRSTRDDLWDAYKDVAPPYIGRSRRHEVSGRVDYDGRVITPIDEDEIRSIAAKIRDEGIETIAVCFVNSYANPEQEQQVQEILRAELPGTEVAISSEILPEIFEFERFSTTVANAVLTPLISGYVDRLGEALKDGKYSGDLLLLHSGGGVMTPSMVNKFSVRLAASGIAAGAIAARHVAQLCGHPHAIGFDMGGTSTDISLIHDGEIRITNEWSVEYGYPICFPSIEILTIGAGGGSLSWIDDAGALHNGPQSAGAVPGPACYGLGGEEPTNADAHLVLGHLGADLVGGGVTLDIDAAKKAINDRIATPLGVSEIEAAQSMLRVANANMADAIRLVSIRKGYDPREFALVAFGGAGPLHGAELAMELAVPNVIVPPHPGITSALGCLLVDVRHDLQRMYLHRVSAVDLADLEKQFAELEAEGRERMEAEGVTEADLTLRRKLSMRYLGQWRSLTIPVPSDGLSMDDAVLQFHEAHEREYAYRRDGAEVEVYQLQLEAIGRTPKPELAKHEVVSHIPEPYSTRKAVFNDPQPVDAALFRRDDLKAGASIEGPAIIEQLDSTVVIPPGVTAIVDEYLMIRMSIPTDLMESA